MKKKIILIEDDQDACMFFKHVLSKAGYAVDHYFDGTFVLNLEYETPDLYILDNCLPGIDGVALTKFLKIKKGTHNVPVLIISSNHAVERRTHEVGASAFVAKPFDVTHLLEVVYNLLESHSYIHESSSDNPPRLTY